MPEPTNRHALDYSSEKSLFGPQDLSDVDLIIGFPIYRKLDEFQRALETFTQNLVSCHHVRPLVVCCAETTDYKSLLETVRQSDLKVPVLTFCATVNDQGDKEPFRTVLEIGNKTEADVILFAPNFAYQDISNLKREYIEELIDAVRSAYDLAVASVPGAPCNEILDSLFVSPLLETFYGCRLNRSMGGIYAIAHDLVEDYYAQSTLWENVIYGNSFDLWLVIRAAALNSRICQVELPSCPKVESFGNIDSLFKNTAGTMFMSIVRDEEEWVNKHRLITKTPDLLGYSRSDGSNDLNLDANNMMALFKRGFSQHEPVISSCLPASLYQDLGGLARRDPSQILSHDNWAEAVCHFMFHYRFSPSSGRDNILSALLAVFCGYAAFILTRSVRFDHLEQATAVNYGNISGILALSRPAITHAFYRFRPQFTTMWKKRSVETEPPLIPAHYMEFVPGIPIVLPKRIAGKNGKTVFTDSLFNRVQKVYIERFNSFIHQSLGVPEDATPGVIAESVRSFIENIEQAMEKLFPGDLYTEEGTRQVVDQLFRLLPPSKMFSVSTRVFKEALLRFPPRNLLIPSGCHTSRELLNIMDARDAATFASLLETRNFTDLSLSWILDNLKPDDMEEIELKPIIVTSATLDGKLRMGGISELNKLTTRIVVRPLRRGTGGDYPRLRFCLTVARHMVMAENYSAMWRVFTRERKNLGEKIKNSLVSSYQTGAFLANNLFEDFHHRLLVERFRNLSRQLAENGRNDEAYVLRLMADSYGLSQVLGDGTFIPCSAWSWSSYSYKGGKGIPTPMSNHIEEKWFSHELAEEIYAELGYHPNEIWRSVVQLLGEGKAGTNILDAHLGIRPKDVVVAAQDTPTFPPAQSLTRHPNNPILQPIPTHPWESRYVLNAASVRFGPYVYILYRAFGDDEVSRIGLAVTDGYRVLERLPYPVFLPQDSKESKGCEDPRVVVIDDQLIMLYTAYDGKIAQIAAASIHVNDFLDRRFDRWQRLGLAFEDIWDKDAILFPEKIRGKYVIYHRIEPSVWVSYLDELQFPIPKDRHSIILGPRSGRMWDSLKIGAGTQPLKTKFGWLMIYHGVDPQRVYRLGVLLVDARNPERVLYRSPNPILSPETGHEIGTIGKCWVPNVVFTCGAVPEKDKEILDEDDRILVYYGAADTYVCLATGTVGDLIPEVIRERILADQELDMTFLPEAHVPTESILRGIRYDYH